MKFLQSGGRLASALLLLACGGSEPTEPPDPSVATTLAASSEASLAGVVGTVVSPSPSVIVKDQNGSPMPNVTVVFQVASGGGSVAGGTVNTSADGIATVGAWTLGPVPGQNVLNASSGTLGVVAFTATSGVGAAASLAKNAGDNQTAITGTAVPIPPSVLVKDASGNPKPGVVVTFAVVSGGGSITGGSATTNDAGIATVGSWVMGAVGVNSLSASAPALPTATFTATSSAVPPGSIVKNAGDNQTAITGTAVSVPPSVLVTDAAGNPKSGVAVTFAVVSGGGSITGAAATTNSAGIAAVGSWTLGTVGVNTLSATTAGLPAVTFTATSSAVPPGSMAKNGGDNQTANAGSPVPVPPSVIVKDAAGNPRVGVSVTFAVVTGGGSITGAAATTNDAGIAAVGSWTLGTVGANTLSATTAGLPAVTFTAQAISTFCPNRPVHTLGTVSSGTLAAGDCQFTDGTFVDFYTVNVPQAGAYMFREGAAFDTYLLLSMADGTAIGENDDESPTITNSAVKALLPAGNYLIAPGAFLPGVTGPYELSSATASSDVSNCEVVFVVKNVTTPQNLAASDCNLNTGVNPIYADGYFIFLTAGTSVTINMTSGTLDSFLELRRLDGSVITQNDNIDGSTKNARITYTSTQSNYYGIFARSVPATSLGSYTLSIQ